MWLDRRAEALRHPKGGGVLRAQRRGLLRHSLAASPKGGGLLRDGWSQNFSVGLAGGSDPLGVSLSMIVGSICASVEPAAAEERPSFAAKACTFSEPSTW